MLIRRPKAEKAIQTEDITNIDTATKTVAVATSSSRNEVQEYMRECFWYYERYAFAKLEEYENALLMFSKIELFTIVNQKRLITGYWMFDGSIFSSTPLEYRRVLPLTLWNKLNIGEKLRLIERRYSDCENVTFRLLFFIIWEEAVNPYLNDPFVIFARRNMESIIEYLVLSRSNERVFQLVCNVLSLDYYGLKAKCRTYLDLLKSTPGVFQPEEGI
jgi:hypothetical protein